MSAFHYVIDHAIATESFIDFIHRQDTLRVLHVFSALGLLGLIFTAAATSGYS